MENQKQNHLSFILSSLLPFFLLLLFSHHILAVEAQNATSASVRVGVLLDLGSMAGKRSKTSISMAIEDFYTKNANFKTRVVLEYKDSMGDVVSAASAALNLLKDSEVQAILGPRTSMETEFVANMCNKSQVPLLSFSASSPSISPSHLPFFVRATINDSSQSKPIASFIQYFGWRNVVPIYEDSDYSSGIIPSLVDDLQSVGTNIPDRAVIPTEANDESIDAELYRLMTLQTRVFIVHMQPSLASRLFLRAQALDMMSLEYVWIVTDSVGDVFETLDSSVIDAMEGVIGFRPYVAYSNEIKNFATRFKTRFLQDNPGTEVINPTVYQYWAYDAVWAMAKAAEMANVTNSSFIVPQSGATDLSRIGVSQTGPKLLQAILNNSFDGLAGKFRLVDNQLQLMAFEIVNMVGKSARTIGYWNQDNGIIREIRNTKINNTLKSIIWPGDSKEVPRGWVVPTVRKKLRILVPIKYGFNEFVNISGSTQKNVPASGVTGYCIDVFDAVLKKLPYDVSYDFYPWDDSDTYDNLVYQVYLNNYDAVVGDITIRYNRSIYVDFTMPFTDSGVSMVVPIKPDASKSMWIFLKPLTTKLWLTSLAFFFFTGFVVWLIEHRINPEFRGTPCQQFGLIFYFAFSTLVFAHKEKLESNLSRFVVIIWVFVVLILTSSYTASLTSMLTVQQLTPTVTDLNQLIKQGNYVGYQDGSFTKGLLINLGFDQNKLRNYSTPDQFADALSNGSVAAIFDEIPYLKVFLSQYSDKYIMAGTTYKTDGFGFVFHRGSPLLPDMSRAVLTVTEGPEMIEIERKWLGGSATLPNQGTNLSSSSLSFRSFAGLFIITGSVSGLMLLCYLAMFIYKEKHELISMVTPDRSLLEIVKLWFGHFDGIDRNAPTLREYVTASMRRRNYEESVRERNLNGSTGSQSPVSISNRASEFNFVTGQEGMLTPPETEIGSPEPSNRGPNEESGSVELTIER